MMDPTPEQKLWADVFQRPREEAPALDREKVLAILESVHDSRQKEAVLLRYGFNGPCLTVQELAARLPRTGGGQGVSKQRAAQLLDEALRHLRHPVRRRAWEQATASSS